MISSKDVNIKLYIDDYSESMNSILNATFMIDNYEFSEIDLKIPLTEINNILYGHGDTKKNKTININIITDLGSSYLNTHFYLNGTFKGSPYQICHQNSDNNISFIKSKDPELQLIIATCIFSVADILIIGYIIYFKCIYNK
jgi:hypothetical protein